MGDQVTLQGLQQMGKNNSGIGAVNPIDAMGFSNFGTIASSTTTIAAAVNKQINLLGATPTIAAEEVTYIATLTAAQLNGVTINCLTLHYDGAAASTGVAAGVDGLTIAKDARFGITPSMSINHTNV